jgi:hypothetical protein
MRTIFAPFRIATKEKTRHMILVFASNIRLTSLTLPYPLEFSTFFLHIAHFYNKLFVFACSQNHYISKSALYIINEQDGSRGAISNRLHTTWFIQHIKKSEVFTLPLVFRPDWTGHLYLQNSYFSGENKGIFSVIVQLELHWNIQWKQPDSLGTSPGIVITVLNQSIRQALWPSVKKKFYICHAQVMQSHAEVRCKSVD